MNSSVLCGSLLCVAVSGAPLPDYFVLEIALAENLVEHDLDVVAGVPIAVVVKAARLLEDAGEFDAARAHDSMYAWVDSWRSSKERFSLVSPQKTS